MRTRCIERVWNGPGRRERKRRGYLVFNGLLNKVARKKSLPAFGKCPINKQPNCLPYFTRSFLSSNRPAGHFRPPNSKWKTNTRLISGPDLSCLNNITGGKTCTSWPRAYAASNSQHPPTHQLRAKTEATYRCKTKSDNFNPIYYFSTFLKPINWSACTQPASTKAR